MVQPQTDFPINPHLPHFIVPSPSRAACARNRTRGRSVWPPDAAENRNSTAVLAPGRQMPDVAGGGVP